MIIFFPHHPIIGKRYIFTDCMTGKTAARTIKRTGSKAIYSDVFNRHETRYWVEMETDDGQTIVSEYELTK